MKDTAIKVSSRTKNGLKEMKRGDMTFEDVILNKMDKDFKKIFDAQDKRKK